MDIALSKVRFSNTVESQDIEAPPRPDSEFNTRQELILKLHQAHDEMNLMQTELDELTKTIDFENRYNVLSSDSEQDRPFFDNAVRRTATNEYKSRYNHNATSPVSSNEEGSDDGSKIKRVPSWAKVSKGKIHSCGYWTLFSWFVLMIIVSLVFIVFTTIAFIDEVNNPIAQYEFTYRTELYLPVVTICPSDLAVPYFPSHHLLHPNRKLLEMYYIRRADGKVCIRSTPVGIDESSGEVVFSESCESMVESFWMQADLFGNNVEVDCDEELGSMNVTKYQDPAFLSTPCKRCFRIGLLDPITVNDTYITLTNTVQMQSAQEYYQCMYDPGGIHLDLLGTGDQPYSVNGLIKSGHRSALKDAGILEFDENELSVSENADFNSEQACNLLFFSGFFVPTAHPNAIQFRFNASTKSWQESGSGPYYRVRTGITVMASGGFEMFLQTSIQETNLINQSISSSEHEFLLSDIRNRMAAAHSFKSEVNQQQQEKPTKHSADGWIHWFKSAFMKGSERHAISPSQRPVRAPLILVGGNDLAFIHFVEQIVIDTVSYTWGSSSSGIFTPLISPHTNNIEYGFGSLVVERFYTRVVVDYWGFIESLFGWFGVFTGLSIYTMFRNPLKGASKKFVDEHGNTRALPRANSLSSEKSITKRFTRRGSRRSVDNNNSETQSRSSCFKGKS